MNAIVFLSIFAIYWSFVRILTRIDVPAALLFSVIVALAFLSGFTLRILHGYEVLLNYFFAHIVGAAAQMVVIATVFVRNQPRTSLLDDALVFAAGVAVVNFHLVPALIL